MLAYNRAMEKTSWGKSSKWYNKIVGESGHYYHQHLIMPSVIKSLDLKPGMSVLDLGCGQGVLARNLPKEIDYCGVDISAALINQAKKYSQSTNQRFMIGDVSAPLSLNQKFDAIVMILSLQNIKNLAGVMQNTKRLSHPRSRLVVVLNHPCFRIPRQSGWEVDERNKLQKRGVTKYMAEMEIPIATHRSSKQSATTWSFHRPLSQYVDQMVKQGFLIEAINELVSDKESQGKVGKMENRSRAEIPLFMVIKAIAQ